MADRAVDVARRNVVAKIPGRVLVRGVCAEGDRSECVPCHVLEVRGFALALVVLVQAEITVNPRARSAKLRVAELLDPDTPRP